MKKNTEELIETVDAPLEAYLPVAMVLQDKDFVIRTCDGDDEYVYLAVMNKSNYVVTEVYPGLSKKETNVREAFEPRDLVLRTKNGFKSIEEVVKMIARLMFEDMEFGQREHLALAPENVQVRALRAVNGGK